LPGQFPVGLPISFQEILLMSVGDSAAVSPAFPVLDDPYPVTAAQLAQFREDGFIKLAGVFDAETLAQWPAASR
jgi:hypothetical protein